MSEVRQRMGYGIGTLLASLLVGFTACGGTHESGGGGGTGGETEAGQGPTAQAGKHAGPGGSGGQPGQNVGGEGGTGGDTPELIGDYRVQATFDDVRVGQIVAWPEQSRVAVTDRTRGVIRAYSVTDAAVEPTEVFKPQELVEGATIVGAIAKYGDGFVATVTKEGPPIQQYVVKVVGTAAPEILLALPDGEQALSIVADPETGVAAQTSSTAGLKLRFAKTGAKTWTVLAEGYPRYSPLAFETDRLLVGVEEADRLRGGEGGAGGEGGGGTLDGSAHVLWLDLEGKELQDFKAYGNPTVAVKDDAGWLIGETNSFWGSYQAGVELLTDTGLKLLTKVPVKSAGDGTDGAYDLVHDRNQVLVANCESGLLQSAFSTSKLTLTPLTGPWDLGTGECGPTAIEAVGDTIVIGGLEPLVFLRRR